MSNAAKLKKRAVELEQKKQFDKALALYVQFLQESEGALDDVDVPLYNRTGDLMLRIGNASDALNYYEKAVDLYAERGFLNNAIALCNKVLRQSPGRASIYYKLGKISATKGFKSDAKKNFLEYADRMQKAGQIDEAFRALKEFADLCPDQDDIRLMLAEQLSKENRQDEALEQLQKLHDKLDSEGRTAEARATVDRMHSIDPEVVPRASGSYQQQKSSDLIFLDTSYEQGARARQPAPHAAPQPAPTPVRQVSDPDLVVLTLADQADAPVSPVHNAAVASAFSLDIGAPNDTAAPTGELALLDVGEGDLLGGAIPEELDIADVPASPAGTPVMDLAPVDLAPVDVAPVELTPVELEPVALAATVYDVELVEPSSTVETPIASLEPAIAVDDIAVTLPPNAPDYSSGPPLSIDYAGDLALDPALPSDDPSGDLFDFRLPPRGDEAADSAPLAGLDPDVSFPSLELDDMSLPSADEVTSGGSLAAALGSDITLGADLGEPDATFDAGSALDFGPETDDSNAEERRVAEGASEQLAAPTSPEGAADAVAGASVGVEASSFDEWSITAAPSATIEGGSFTAGSPPEDVESAPDLAWAAPADADPASDIAQFDNLDLVDAARAADDTPFLELAPALDEEPAPSDAAGDSGVQSSAVDEPDVAVAPDELAAVHAVDGAGDARRPSTQWDSGREHAEQLLEAGDRAGGVQELEQMSAALERSGDLEHALVIVDELIRLSPDSVNHHQKRVELAFRASDRAKLIGAYIELGDALFRSGEEPKARAVYQRVLELAPEDPRARAALESVASASPPGGSGVIDAVRPSSSQLSVRADSHASVQRAVSAAARTSAPQPASGGAGRHPIGISATPQSRKPSPLDRSASANGEFVDLGEWLRSDESPKSTRMITDEKPPTGDEQADFQEMLKRFKQGVADNVDDEDYESHYDLGVAYKEMGLMDEAVAEFQKALRGSAHRVRAYEALGQCFVEKEQYQVAASVLSRAIALGEGDDHYLVGVLYLLGRATEALSRNGDALDYYQRVFAVDIEFRDVAERISAIERKAT